MTSRPADAARGDARVRQAARVDSDPSRKGKSVPVRQKRPGPEELLRAARRREVDAILRWRLDRLGRSLLDLNGSLQELHAIGVGFVSLTEALDMTTPGGRTLAGMLAVLAEFERNSLRDRVKVGIAQACKDGRPQSRPPAVQRHAAEIAFLFAGGINKRQIAARLRISRALVRRMFGISAHGRRGRGTGRLRLARQ